MPYPGDTWSHLGPPDLKGRSVGLWRPLYPPPHPHSLSNLNLPLGFHPMSGLSSGLCPQDWWSSTHQLHDLQPCTSSGPSSLCSFSTHFWCHTSQVGCPGQGSPELGVLWAKGPLNCDCQGHLECTGKHVFPGRHSWPQGRRPSLRSSRPLRGAGRAAGPGGFAATPVGSRSGFVRVRATAAVLLNFHTVRR